MLKNSVLSLSKICTSKFVLKTRSNELVKFRLMQLPIERYEEYIDFRMKYYVNYELTHQIAGIPESEEAKQEYREIMWRTCLGPSITNIICCLDNGDNPKIVGISTQKLIKAGDREEEIAAQTKPVKRFYEILNTWNSLYSIPDLMRNFKLTLYCDDMGVAIHPQFYRLGLANKMVSHRREICKYHSATMTGAWTTSLGTWKACVRDGWETVYEISYEELGRILGVRFENSPPSTAYMILKV